MAEAIEPHWKAAICEWAAAKPAIAEVFLYGSRVKGTHLAESDLDVAIRIEQSSESDLTTWIFEGKEWAKELDKRLDVPIHLEMISEDDTVVLPAVRDHGIRIYVRN